ncbi:MAG: lysylphosphatidylglycerol synthase domain-containing protein [Gemmatimonadaceae bacterium]
MRALPRKVLIVGQLAAAALLFYFVWRTLADQWIDFRTQPLETDLGLGKLVASAVLVFATYGLLVQLWRMLIAGAGASLRFWPALRIWAVSGLWRYVPGKIWSIGAMSTMAHRENVPAVAAAGTAVLNTVLNIACGIAISLLLVWRWLSEVNRGLQPAAVVLLVLATLGLLALPYVAPRLAALAGRISGREITFRSPPAWALALAVAGNMLAWALYGTSFMLLVQGVLGEASAPVWQYIAVFTASYVIGYLFLLAPGGIGPREAVMIQLMTSLGLATAKEAALVAVASRIWLTILEIIPGLLFLAFTRAKHRAPIGPTDASRQ